MKKELQNKRTQLALEMRAIFNKSEAEKRGLNADENEKWERLRAEIESVDATLAKLDATEKIEGASAPAQPVGDGRGAAAPESDPLYQRLKARGKWVPQSAHDRAFSTFLRNGVGGLNAEERNLLGNFREDGGRGIRAAQTTTTSGGGYLIPAGFSGQIEEAMKQYGGMLQSADVIDTETGNPLPWPTDNDTTNSGAMLAINTQASEVDFTFGQVTFGAYKFSSNLVLVPIELLQDSYFDLNSYIVQRFAVRLGRILNNKFTVGSGSSEPTGVITAATLGTTGATGETTSLIYDDLVKLEHSVDPAYRQSKSVRWMCADSTIQAIKLLKDSAGRPLWLPSFQASFDGKFPDTILGYPIQVNQDMPVMAANAKSILFGDFSKYKIRRVLEMTVLRLVERYADYGQVGFIAFMRADGNLIDAGTHPVKYFANSAS